MSIDRAEFIAGLGTSGLPVLSVTMKLRCRPLYA